jgi:demethylmenaquinone methyltransferase / 2-methoxy-6-polyprenyl-1,4-benzoquinol methylase
MAEVGTPAKGTLPAGAQTEADASRQVRQMFTQIAPRYDLLNHLLSGQLDRLWRARTARRLRPILDRADAVVLDLCCGTGDLAFALAHGSQVRIIGADFSHAMLVHARQKSGALCSSSERMATDGGPLPFLEADALKLPFPENSFDLITTAFGFRNLANYEAGLREIQRVLKPGGSVAILEFTEPPAGLVGNFYRFYFRNILPRLGGLISGDSSAYTYLPRSVSRFFRPSELATLMANVGYASPKFEIWTFGTVALHTASKV